MNGNIIVVILYYTNFIRWLNKLYWLKTRSGTIFLAETWLQNFRKYYLFRRQVNLSR